MIAKNTKYTKRTLIGIGAAALLATGGAATSASAVQPDTAAQPGTVSGAAAGQQVLGKSGYSKAHPKYTYASARWTWKGPGSTGKVKVYVNDISCKDGDDAFAFMQFERATGQVVTGESRFWNYNSDCKGKGVSRKGPSFSDGFNITHARVVACKDDKLGSGDTCKKGNWHKNPYA
ncbi:hypothetical protein H181DRAFT_01792 [Streptomyces sp. WMMB 714]|uniref:hypothetical protein n=1 Tax=Streptomyces sp. WMMB 714 TaxID=1286822 RepID=UPI0005F7FDF5|nr:hypothetical protein [Streptomyces sp. WMMB 714]SCK23802.1 hypothetical protein H181DRAFT_01792 [Streptomyces sp. WMMB 714]